jgi:hypothetical protein
LAAQTDESAVREYLFAACGNFPDEETHLPHWKALRSRSLSVGDFVRINEGKWFQCAPTGWIEVSEERVNEVMAMPQYYYWRDENLYPKVVTI